MELQTKCPRDDLIQRVLGKQSEGCAGGAWSGWHSSSWCPPSPSPRQWTSQSHDVLGPGVTGTSPTARSTAPSPGLTPPEGLRLARYELAVKKLCHPGKINSLCVCFLWQSMMTLRGQWWCGSHIACLRCCCIVHFLCLLAPNGRLEQIKKDMDMQQDTLYNFSLTLNSGHIHRTQTYDVITFVKKTISNLPFSHMINCLTFRIAFKIAFCLVQQLTCLCYSNWENCGFL